MNNSQQMNVNLTEVDNVTCEECGGTHFSPTFIIKRISALMSPTGQETMAPIQIFKCDSCSHVNELFLQGLTN
jgi:alanyl-tRNA synthetase